MKMLLTTLNAKYVHSNLALKYLYAIAASRFPQVELREFTINNAADYVFCELIRGDYDVVCFSCYVWNIRQTLSLAESLKKARPECQIIFGGPEVSFDPAGFLADNSFVDVLMMGEGESTFSQLLKQMEQDKPELGLVLGLAYRCEGRVQVNPLAPLVDFKTVPFPYETLACEEDKVAYYESVRGCPFRCSYCLSSVDKSIRTLPMDRIKTDLSYFIYKRVKQVKLIDRTFNYDILRCNDIIKYLIENDNGITNFHLEICGDLLDETTLGLLSQARPGLFQMEIGIQSTNPATLESIHRSNSFEKLVENINRLRKIGGIHLHLDLIAGLPYEDYITFKKSFNDVYALRPDALQLGFLKLLKGAPLREQASQYQYVYREEAPYEVISNAFISADGLVRLKMIENVLDLYYNRGGFSKTVEWAAFVLYETPFDFYQELANFYYLKGFQHRSYKKEDVYRILHQFFTWKNHRDAGEETNAFVLLDEDLKGAMNPEAVKKFEKKGWNMG